MMPLASGPVASGFFGKLPARGDFVRSGLPTSFVAAWDDWIAGALTASREILGEEWQPAWLEAPVWRFALPGGMCGRDCAVGLFLPSVDRAGRFFPLCFARLLPNAIPAEAAVVEYAWLASAEAAGRAALAEDLAPEALAARLESADAAATGVPLPPALAIAAAGYGLWWTEGSPRVAAGGFAAGALPGPRRFAGMLDERFLEVAAAEETAR